VAAGPDAGGYVSFEAAQDRMSSLKEKRFTPNPLAKAAYDELYSLYRELHDAFGGVEGAKVDLGSFMKRLLVIRERQSGE
jgi:L-ribulokinase